MFEGWNLGLPWLPDGIRNGTDLPRGWRPSPRHGARPFVQLDGRRLEIIADGLPLWRGARLAIDTTLVSPIRADGTARRHAAHRDGVALEEARRTKERKYPELAGNGGRARLVVVAAEVGGRFSAEANQFLRGLVSAKVRGVPDILKGKAAAAWSRRWRSMLGCVVANSFALSLLGRVPPGADGEVPLVSDVLGAQVRVIVVATHIFDGLSIFGRQKKT